MAEPVARRRPMIDLDEFERRLRQSTAANQSGADPLAELARLSSGQDDPYGNVFAAPDKPAPTIKSLEPNEGAHGRERPIGGDFAAIQAGLLGVAREEPAVFAEPEKPADFPSFGPEPEDWRFEEEAQFAQPSDAPEEDMRSRRPLYLMAAIIAVGIAGIGASFALRGGGSAPHEVATIKAAAGPSKIQPETAGGAEAPNDDASILDQNSQPSNVALSDHTEQPLDLSQAQEKAPRVIGLGGNANFDSLAAGAANVPVPTPSAQPQPDAKSQGDGLTIAGLIEPRKVKTVSVRPDGTLLPNDRPPQMPVQPSSAANAPAPTNKASTPKSTARVATTPRVATAQTEAASAQTAEAAKTNAARAKPVQVADAQAASAPVKAAESGGFAVQLAAPASEKEAREIQIKLMKKFGGELAGFHPSIHKATVGDKPVYRVRLTNLSREEATALCEKIQGGGGNCFVAKN